MKLDALLRAHEFMKVERPPELWEADVEDVAVIRLMGEMIVFGLRNGTELSELTLNASNVVVEEASEHLPAGEFVALTIRGSRNEVPEIVWWPGSSVTFDPYGDLEGVATEAGAVYAYSRWTGEGSITVFMRRA
jgi:hypothetical protein